MTNDKIKAKDVREMAQSAIANGRATDRGGVFKDVEGNRYAVTVKSDAKRVYGGYLGFMQLASGELLAWYNRKRYSMRNEAGALAKELNRQRARWTA